jgi:hypothetical protein
MGTWKIIAPGAVLTAALIATIAHQGSDGSARSGVADHAKTSRQHIHGMSPVADPVATRKPDTDKALETETWGPFRATDW